MTPKSNAEELALIAEEIGAQVLRGVVRYPSEMGDIAVGDVDIRHLRHPRPLVIGAWLWLQAQLDDLEENRRWLEVAGMQGRYEETELEQLWLWCLG